MIAAGHRCTAAAGAQVLSQGGNAVDAAIAACFAALVAEPTLTGLGAGGFMLVHDPRRDTPVVLDFFVAAGGIGSDRVRAELTPTPVDFGTTVQMFYGGHASIAVPGMAAGLFAAHHEFGTVDMSELIRPACDLAREGVEQTAQQERLNALLAGVNALTEESRRVYLPDGHPLRAGERFTLLDIVDTLQGLVSQGPAWLYGGELGQRLIDEVNSGGGVMTLADLEQYQVITREPTKCDYGGFQVYSNPSPATGGRLVSVILDRLASADLGGAQFQDEQHLEALIGALRQALTARQNNFANLGNTTHISVIAADGMAVSVTSSDGANSGVVLAGTGIVLNNMLGEADLQPLDGPPQPGQRLGNMMSPTIVLEQGTPRLVLGSAGSNRICSAVSEVISSVLDFGLDIAAAVNAPRVHIESETVELEAGIAGHVADALASAGHKLNRWPDQNLYFGGLQAVSRGGNGELSGAGDPRRGGFAITV